MHVIIGFDSQLRQLAEIMERHDICHTFKDVAEFFTYLLINHFYSRSGDNPWCEMWELFEEQLDNFAHNGEGEILLKMIESVDAKTREMLPGYSETGRNLQIEDAHILGSSSIALVVVRP